MCLLLLIPNLYVGVQSVCLPVGKIDAAVGSANPEVISTDPHITLVPEITEDGYLEVRVYAVNCVGLEAIYFTVTYDPDCLEFLKYLLGKDAVQIDYIRNNSLWLECNPETAGVIKTGFYFLL